MEEAIANIGNVPLVSSALYNNLESISLLSKFMTSYGFSKTGKYVRFVDNKHYEKLYGNIQNESPEIMSSSKS